MADYDWKKIKTEYITTTISYRKLCDKYNIPFNTLQCRANKERWVDLRKNHQDAVVTKSVANLERKATDYRSTIYDLAYKVAQQLVDMTNDHTISELATIGIKPRDITGAIKDLEDALHIKCDNDLLEQEARIAKLRKDAEDKTQADQSIKVIISPGLDEYSE